MTTKRQAPELRFHEFDSPWEITRLGKKASFAKGKGISKADIDENGQHPCIRYGELYTHYGTVINEVRSFTNSDVSSLVLSKGDEVLIPASGETAIDIATASVVTVKNVILGGDLNIIKTEIDGAFLANYLSGKKKTQIARLTQGISVIHLYSSQLKLLEVAIPSIAEQRKIAEFLGAVDAKLDALRRKRELLAEYKRGVMQKLFTQEIRFVGDGGRPFADWETCKLGDVFARVTRKNSENNQNVLTISAQQGLINQKEFFNKSVAANDVTRYYLLTKDEFAYNKSRAGGYPLGAIKRLRRYEKGVVSTLYICFRAKFKTEIDFYEHYFESSFLNRELYKIAQEGARSHGLLNICVTEFFHDIRIPRPSVEEQQKIADFLTAIDAKITAVDQQITHMETFKKGLLQQMFV